MVIVTGQATDWYDPKSVRASMGSLFAIPRIRHPSLQEILRWCRHHHIRVVATSAHASTSYLELDYTRPTAFLVGNEASGLGQIALEQADVAVRIPMFGHADSLNVAVAAGLFLFEALRQRTSPKPNSGSSGE